MRACASNVAAVRAREWRARATRTASNAHSTVRLLPPIRRHRRRATRARALRASLDDDVVDDVDLAEDEFDDDAYAVQASDEGVLGITTWLALVERATTVGAVSSGVASVLTREIAFGAIAGTLPLVGALARRARERRLREKFRARATARREELNALRTKAARNVTISEATRAATPQMVAAMRKDVAPALEEFAKRLSAMERAQADAAKSAAATARDSGAVAGMLARDLAAARVDARDGFASVRDELKATAESSKGEMKKEMTMLWELVEAVEKDAADLREPMATLAEEIRDVVEGVVRENISTSALVDGDDPAAASRRDETLMLSDAQLDELRAVVADTASERIREAIDELLDSMNAVTSDASVVQTLASRLDDSQWSALTARLDAIDASVSGGVVEDDLEDLRVEIRREISKDIQDVLDSVNELKIALEANKAAGVGSGGQEAAAAVKRWAEDKLKTAPPSRDIDEQIRWQAAFSESAPSEDEELVWVGETKRDDAKASASKSAKLNEGVTREQAFANMQALLNAKPVDEPPMKDMEPATIAVTSTPTSSSVTAQTDDEDDEEVWDPFVTAADAENVAKYIKENEERARTADDPTTSDKDAYTTLSENGLTSLRTGRDIARRGGDDIDALEDADEKFAMAIKSFEKALELNPTPGAEGNLGNAHLARGRVQAVLAELAMEESREARRVGMNAGLEGTAEMYLELAEENLIQAGRRFRVAASGLQSNGDESSAGIKGRAKALTGWGAALSLRSELVLSSQGDVADAESLVVAAVEKFKAAAAIEPDSPTIYVSWGDAMRMCASLGTIDDEDERLKQAEGCYREALRLDPECVAALDALEELSL